MSALDKQKKIFYFLHKQGYTFISIPKLVPVEINMLVEQWNIEEKAKQKAQKRNESKKKNSRTR